MQYDVSVAGKHAPRSMPPKHGFTPASSAASPETVIDAQVTMGNLEIIVPEDLAVEVNVDTVAGHVEEVHDLGGLGHARDEETDAEHDARGEGEEDTLHAAPPVSLPTTT